MAAEIARLADRRPPLPADRQALADANAAVVDAHRMLAEVDAPLSRITQAANGIAAAERRLAECRAADDAELATWIAAGASGERPKPSTDTITAERSLVLARGDASAAATLRADLEGRHAAALARHREAAARRDEIMNSAALAAAQSLLLEYRTAIEQMLRIENTLNGVAAKLFAIADRHATRSPASAIAAGAAIRAGIARAKQEAGVVPDLSIGGAFIDALASDPGATLEVKP
ncbi:MAG TPA: hypothetical protein VND87_12135 [Stellaceae bacterium]|nr:hypothetical protein [Stellaceae bacterium]